MWVRRKSSAFQDDIEAELKLKPELMGKRARAANEKENYRSSNRIQIPRLGLYSTFFAESAESSKTAPLAYHLKKCTSGLKLQHLGLILLYYVMPACLSPLCVCKTLNWPTLPNETWGKYNHLGASIRGNFPRPVSTKHNRVSPRVIFFSVNKNKNGFASYAPN